MRSGNEDIGVEGRTVVRRGREAVVTRRTVVTMGRMSSEAAKDSGDDGKDNSGDEGKEDSNDEGKEDSGDGGKEDSGDEGNEDSGDEGKEDSGDAEGKEDSGDAEGKERRTVGRREMGTMVKRKGGEGGHA